MKRSLDFLKLSTCEESLEVRNLAYLDATAAKDNGKGKGKGKGMRPGRERFRNRSNEDKWRIPNKWTGLVNGPRLRWHGFSEC